MVVADSADAVEVGSDAGGTAGDAITGGTSAGIVADAADSIPAVGAATDAGGVLSVSSCFSNSSNRARICRNSSRSCSTDRDCSSLMGTGRLSLVTVGYQSFVPLPSDEAIVIAWPTPNHALRVAPEKFFARTRANPDYGKPGWTRDCGRRFHRGVDIAPVQFSPTGATTTVVFTDCATGRDYESAEPIWIPHDPVFCVFDGTVLERVDDESQSDFGRHVVVEHRWPHSGEPFRTIYAHLDRIVIGNAGTPVSGGQQLGWMGQTARSPDARNWLRIAPHLHFEVQSAAGIAYDPVEFLRRYVAG